jgi:hypothetical protein
MDAIHNPAYTNGRYQRRFHESSDVERSIDCSISSERSSDIPSVSNEQARSHNYNRSTQRNDTSTVTTASDRNQNLSVRNMCYGCGHITNPPHRRMDCPHKDEHGWCAIGIPKGPMILTSSSSSSKRDKSRAMVNAVMGPSLTDLQQNPIKVAISLATASSCSLISSKMFQKLEELGCFIQVKESKTHFLGFTLGSANIFRFVDCFIHFNEMVQQPFTVQMKLGVADIPMDILIGWRDMNEYKLMPILSALANEPDSESSPPVETVSFSNVNFRPKSNQKAYKRR